ncbi:MAG: LPS-assembly protein LptD [Zoogloeaceae bacterium]|nr:LPS-assembly protein LptD [Zoogloeaceae bacterium]
MCRRRPVVIALACLFAGGQVVQAAPLHAHSDMAELFPDASRLVPAMPTLALDTYRDPRVTAPLALRPSMQLQSAVQDGSASSAVVKKKEKASHPAFLTADKMGGQTDEVSHAEGHVELRTVDGLLFADKLDYYPLEDEVRATGNVRLLQEGAEVSGPYLQLKMTDQVGYFEEARYKISRMMENSNNDQNVSPMLAAPLPELPLRMSTGYGQAKRINFEGENQFRLKGGTYSTCAPDEQTRQDWYAKSSDIKLDYDRNEGVSRNATVYFKDVPILYAPYLSFSLNNQRKSGVLAPTFSSSTRTGLDLSIPYYWNIAPNYDATLTPRIMSKRGLQMGAEVRYMDHYANSEARVEYLANDNQYGGNRYAYELKHQQNLGGGFSAYLDWNGVSDDNYFTDLSSRVVQTSQRQLTRHFQLDYSRDWVSASLRTLRYQTLNPSDEKNYHLEHPYFLEPQLTLNVHPMAWKGLEFQAQGQYTDFTHPTLEEGKRTVFYPQVSLPFIRPGYYITPKFGLHMSRYQLDQRAANMPESLSRNLPIFSLDMGMTFERETTLLGNRWTQTLEPRLYYLNIPYRDQSRYPVFDSGLADFNFGQIFSENRFSGYDRINNARQLTAALTTRLIDPETGGERARAMVGQRYYFRDLKVGLQGETLYHDKYSDFLVALSGQVAPHTYVDTAAEYNFKHATTERATLAARYQPDYGKVISIAYRYNRGVNWSTRMQNVESMEQIDIAGQWRLSNRWYAVGRYNYAFDSSRLVEGIAGLEYNAGCWVARAVVQRLETTAGDPNTSMFFQLELNDFGQIGSNPIQMLRRSVPGYSKINELPTLSSGGLLSDD